MELDWTTFILEIINFLVLVWILHRFLYQPVMNVIAQRRAHHRAYREIGHVVIVHHVEVDHIGTGRHHGIDFGTQPGKIRRQYRRCNSIVTHRTVPLG